MTNSHDQRRTILQQIIHKLENGVNVPIKDIRQVLTTAEWAALEMKIRPLPAMKIRGKLPSSLKRYVECLRRADLLHARAESLGNSAHRPSLYGIQAFRRPPFPRTAEQEYEYALEILEESLSETPGIRCWLDRPVCFGHDDCVSAAPEGMPRLITSRSRFARTEKTRNKRELKLIALQDSLARLESMCVI
ncbi:hypothetical protein EGT07_07875 [Herbaspirillum sp. HC18]|nr:hypothetical protein EGT07_07875 [Herbaspirillum sp. HC18]